MQVATGDSSSRPGRTQQQTSRDLSDQRKHQPAAAGQPVGSQAAAAAGAHQHQPTSRTKKQPPTQHGQNLQETFVDDGVSVVHVSSQQGTGLNRSLSNVTQKVKNTIPKPVRRSKSQLPGTKFVTNIQHGGPVTLVSLSNDSGQNKVPEFQHIDRDLINKGQGVHAGRTFVPAFSGSNTLPKAGLRKKKVATGAESVDDSDIVITKRVTGGGSSVRIRIGSARTPVEELAGEGSEAYEGAEEEGQVGWSGMGSPHAPQGHRSTRRGALTWSDWGSPSGPPA